MDALPAFDIPANVRIVGSPGKTAVLLSSTNDDAYVAFAGSAGDNVTIEGIKLLRNTDCNMVFFYPGGHDGFHLENCVVDGRYSKNGKSVHGLVLNRDGKKRHITINRCTITQVVFGVLQANDITADTDMIVVNDSIFFKNFGDDLGFNAPKASMTNVTVTSSRFIQNASTSTPAGYGVAFAHVINGLVRDCYFESYYNEAIHVEDHSSNIIISGNTLVTCGTDAEQTPTDLDRGGIVVTSGSSDIFITNNVLDHTANLNKLHGIVIKNINGVVTAGGRPMVAPRKCLVSDNIIKCGKNYQGIWIANVTDATVRGNRIAGAGNAVGADWDDGNSGSGIKIDGTGSAVDANTVSGFRYGIRGPVVDDGEVDQGVNVWNRRTALGNPGNVTGNRITDCYVGVVAVPAASLTISGNTLADCIRPMVVEESEQPDEPSAVTGNFALRCRFPLEIGGKLILLRTPGGSTVTAGVARVIQIQDNLRSILPGTVITFSGGAVLTVTASIPDPQLYSPGRAYELVGDVIGPDIGVNEYGTVTSAVDRKVTVAYNIDTAGP